jgi:hypothetical protein
MAGGYSSLINPAQQKSNRPLPRPAAALKPINGYICCEGDKRLIVIRYGLTDG